MYFTINIKISFYYLFFKKKTERFILSNAEEIIMSMLKETKGSGSQKRKKRARPPCSWTSTWHDVGQRC